jgi:hypothetical protein
MTKGRIASNFPRLTTPDRGGVAKLEGIKRHITPSVAGIGMVDPVDGEEILRIIADQSELKRLDWANKSCTP